MVAVMEKKRKNPARDRIEIRADPEWIDRVNAAAEKVGLSISAFLRLAGNRLMSDPEFAPPVKKPSKK